MSLRQLPAIKAFDAPPGASWDAPSDALALWSEQVFAAEANDAATISIYDVIGFDPFSGEGFTAQRMAGALRAIGPNPVTVAINSPGGSVFEGIAIYNLLREHPAVVTVKVLGIAGSIASVIAMAGDEIAMGTGSKMMVHKAWGAVVGNDDDLRAAADILGSVSRSMAEIYSARTGKTDAEVMKIMAGTGKGADGTWMTAAEAISAGFADKMTTDVPPADGAARAEVSARRRVDALLAQQGVPRSERRRMLRDLGGKHDAATDTTPRAGDDELAASLRSLIETIRS